MPSSHDDGVSMDAIDALVREDFDGGETSLILDLDVIARARYLAHTHPAANRVVLTDDRVRKQ